MEAWRPDTKMLKLALDGDSFFDGRNGVGIEPSRNSEKHLRFRHFAGDLQYALVMTVDGTADYEAVFENLVLPRRRVTLLHEAVVVVERHLNDHLHWPTLFLPARKLSADLSTVKAQAFVNSELRLLVLVSKAE
jgi:hypothetical protein